MSTGRGIDSQADVLLRGGQLEELHRFMLKKWPPEDLWAPPDVGGTCDILLAAIERYGFDAHFLYRPYSQRLRSQYPDHVWLRTLWLRSITIRAYEGYQFALAWLDELLDRLVPPDSGIVHLARGTLVLESGSAELAREDLRCALELSTAGIEWYRLEAINELWRCTAKLSKYRLAFEYARTHSIESYKLGRINRRDLYKALRGNALLHGQLDYLSELQRNVAAEYLSQGNLDWAALELSEGGLRLSQLGLGGEAANWLVEAASYADTGTGATDPAFAVTCNLLARFVDPQPVESRDIEGAAELINRLRPRDDVRSAMKTIAANLKDPDVKTVPVRCIRDACTNYKRRGSLPPRELMLLLCVLHFCALVGRYYRGKKSNALSLEFYQIIWESCGNRDAIFQFAGEEIAEQLLEVEDYQHCLSMCELFIQTPWLQVHDRFRFEQIIACCHLKLGRKQLAYNMARSALNDWARVLSGLYVNEHKEAWLSRGALALRTALEAISEPVVWMDEQARRCEVFNLIERGKARIAADMINRRGYEVGAFTNSEGLLGKRDDFDAEAEDFADYYILFGLQAASYADSLQVVFHDDDGSTRAYQELDIAPLRYTVLLPETPDKVLVTSAVSLPYDRKYAPVDESLYEEITRRSRSEHGSDGS